MDYLADIRAQVSGSLNNGKIDSLAAQSGSMNQGNDAKLKKLSQQFESVLVNQLMTSMRSTIPKSGLFNSFTTDFYDSMYDQELANQISMGRGVGLSDMLYRELSKIDAGMRGATQTPGRDQTGGMPNALPKTDGDTP